MDRGKDDRSSAFGLVGRGAGLRRGEARLRLARRLSSSSLLASRGDGSYKVVADFLAARLALQFVVTLYVLCPAGYAILSRVFGVPLSAPFSICIAEAKRYHLSERRMAP